MIAVDTSSLRRFLAGERGRDVDLVIGAIGEGRAILPPPVLCEALSDPAIPADLSRDLAGLPLLEIRDGYWRRAGLLRGRVIAAGRKAKLADALIAQCCIDHQVALITNDRDFRHFVPQGLTLA
ncbi:MAG TPA: PIN domain-containing protein [Thermoanaerobaculia bacterium]|nr:PIN domain-containing protein [Thermoanaerobaculia bacterium]